MLSPTLSKQVNSKALQQFANVFFLFFSSYYEWKNERKEKEYSSEASY